MKSWMKELGGRIYEPFHRSVNGVKYFWVKAKAKANEVAEYSEQRTVSLISTYLTRGLGVEVKYDGKNRYNELVFIVKVEGDDNQKKKMLYVMAKDLMDHCKSGTPDAEYVKELRALGNDVTKDRTKEFLYDLEIDDVPPGHKVNGSKPKNSTSKTKTSDNSKSQVAVAQRTIPIEFVIVALLAVAWVLWDE